MEASDAWIGPWVDYRYTPSENLSKDAQPRAVYQLQLAGTPESVLSVVGAAFGVTGAVEKSQYFDPVWPTYYIGTEEWTAPAVTLTWSGTGNWWYSNPDAYPAFDCEVSSSDDGQDSVERCDEPVPAGPVPSVADAKKRAAELFTATGFPVSENTIRLVYSDEWGVYLSAALFVDGQETAVEWAIGFGPNGVISHASGHSVSVVNRGTFDTVSAYDAVERMADGMWWGSAPMSFYSESGIAFGSSATTDIGVVEEEAPTPDEDDQPAERPVDDDTPVGSDTPGDSGEGGDPAPGGDSEAPEEPVSPDTPVDSGDGSEPFPGVDEEWPTEPEIVEVEITSATAALLLVFDSSSGAWLVPGFVMEHDEGWPVSVISLVPGVVALPEPEDYWIEPMIEPMIEPGVVDEGTN
jgi:hypothetical protein